MQTYSYSITRTSADSSRRPGAFVDVPISIEFIDRAPSSPPAQKNPHQPRHLSAPPSLPPRGLARTEAAGYIGISPSFFDKLVADEKMPPPFSIGSRKLWDRRRLDAAIDALVGEASSDDVNPWDAP